MEIKLVEKQ